MAFLCVKVIFLKDGRFSSIHIHDSEDMKNARYTALWIKTERCVQKTFLPQKKESDNLNIT